MRICFYNVTASFIPGGLETYCWEAGRALARRGHDVTIVAGDRGSARHREVKLVQFPFRIEQDWPDLGTRFRRLMERLSFARHSLDHLARAGYDLRTTRRRQQLGQVPTMVAFDRRPIIPDRQDCLASGAR